MGSNFKNFIEYDTTWAEPLQSDAERQNYDFYWSLRKCICTYPAGTGTMGADEPYAASYLAVIPPPSTHSNIRHIMDKMQSWWTAGKAQSQGGFSQDPEQALCKYSDLEWTDIVTEFESEDLLHQYMATDKYAASPWDPTNPQSHGVRPVSFAIVFNEYEDWNRMSYTLRGNATYFASTEGAGISIEKDMEILASGEDGGYGKYRDGGLTDIQFALNQIITAKIINPQPVDFQYGIFPMPTAAFVDDPFWATLGDFLPFVMIIAFIYPYFVITGHVVYEKANKIKEGLTMMGASITTYWTSIYLYYGLKFTIISTLCTLTTWLVKVFEYSSPIIIWLWFTLFLYTLLTSAIMFSTLFDNPKTASTVSTIFLLGLYFLSGIADSLDSAGKKTATCLSGPACFAMGMKNFAKYEEAQIGLDFDTAQEG